MHDRAQQALHLTALEPVSESIVEPNSYGFRPKPPILSLRLANSETRITTAAVIKYLLIIQGIRDSYKSNNKLFDNMSNFYS